MSIGENEQVVSDIAYDAAVIATFYCQRDLIQSLVGCLTTQLQLEAETTNAWQNQRKQTFLRCYDFDARQLTTPPSSN